MVSNKQRRHHKHPTLIVTDITKVKVENTDVEERKPFCGRCTSKIKLRNRRLAITLMCSALRKTLWRQKQRRLSPTLVISRKFALTVQKSSQYPAYLVYHTCECEQLLGINRYSTTHALLLRGGLFLYPLK
jgi:hypothetical protein